LVGSSGVGAAAVAVVEALERSASVVADEAFGFGAETDVGTGATAAAL
jgi:hypothetical protein